MHAGLTRVLLGLGLLLGVCPAAGFLQPGPRRLSSSSREGDMVGPSLPPPSQVALTVVGPDGSKRQLSGVKVGANLRKTLQQGKVEVYDLMGKLSNCNGAGQCGTCVVRVEAGAWGGRSQYEESKLQAKGWGKDPLFRLACQTPVGPGDATVTVRPTKPKK